MDSDDGGRIKKTNWPLAIMMVLVTLFVALFSVLVPLGTKRIGRSYLANSILALCNDPTYNQERTFFRVELKPNYSHFDVSNPGYGFRYYFGNKLELLGNLTKVKEQCKQIGGSLLKIETVQEACEMSYIHVKLRSELYQERFWIDADEKIASKLGRQCMDFGYTPLNSSGVAVSSGSATTVVFFWPKHHSKYGCWIMGDPADSYMPICKVAAVTDDSLPMHGKV